MKRLQLPIDVNIYTYSSIDEEKTRMWETFRPDPNMPLQVDQVGEWSMKNGLTFFEDNLWERRKDLKGKTFSAATKTVNT